MAARLNVEYLEGGSDEAMTVSVSLGGVNGESERDLQTVKNLPIALGNILSGNAITDANQLLPELAAMSARERQYNLRQFGGSEKMTYTYLLTFDSAFRGLGSTAFVTLLREVVKDEMSRLAEIDKDARARARTAEQRVKVQRGKPRVSPALG